ncbi:MAG TPA: asparaginase [Casimicrobiaceae bacterium]|nr:asparaginase [Casimicrobiaceae bacterium]
MTLPHVPVAVTTRGDTVESVHYGSIAVVDVDGRLLHAAGDPQFVTFTRSALKPLQALPFVEDGGPAHFHYADVQIALLCASHSGEPAQVDGVADMLARAGLSAADLQCGTHAPGFYDVRGETPPAPPWSPLAHNCSGKHAGMLAACRLHGWSVLDYLDTDHPLQRRIRQTVSEFADVPVDALRCGIDGCSAPNYAMPLAKLAQAFARLAAGGTRLDRAAATLRNAMTAHPEMVSGAGRGDLELARAGRGDWVPKVGAEGVQAVGIASRGIGVAVKIADGARRALLPAVVAVLDQIGILDATQRQALSTLREPTLTNYRAIATGRVRPIVDLTRGPAPA